MQIGIPKEVKNHEYRVGLLPQSVALLVQAGHQLWVESNAGVGAGYEDELYRQAGATLCDTAEDVWAKSTLIVKVKEPQPEEYPRITAQHTLFTYFHLAPEPALTQALLDSGATCIAYETITDAHGGLPLLAPMSMIAGKLAAQIGAHYLLSPQGGNGVLMGGVPGVAPANVMILGAGVVGVNAAAVAVGMGATVTVYDINADALARVQQRFGSAIQTRFSTQDTVSSGLAMADLVIGAVLVPGARAPKVITQAMLAFMPLHSVVVDVAIDQGGCLETSKPTTHAHPTYETAGVTHYCVTNMPGAVGRTATQALNAATLPFVLAMAEKGVVHACECNPHLNAGKLISGGKLFDKRVADAQNRAFTI